MHCPQTNLETKGEKVIDMFVFKQLKVLAIFSPRKNTKIFPNALETVFVNLRCKKNWLKI